MRRVIPLVLLSMLALVPFSNSSPTDGSSSRKHKVEASTPWTTTKTFRGGEQACVMVFGDHDPVVNLHLSVYDAKGNLVAEDKGNNSLVGDFVGVVWYPPRTGDYKIELRNPGPKMNDCYVAIK